jgi:hypothetical protein
VENLGAVVEAVAVSNMRVEKKIRSVVKSEVVVGGE